MIPLSTINLKNDMENKEIEEEYHLLPQIDAKKKDPVSREYTLTMDGTI